MVRATTSRLAEPPTTPETSRITTPPPPSSSTPPMPSTPRRFPRPVRAPTAPLHGPRSITPPRPADSDENPSPTPLPTPKKTPRKRTGQGKSSIALDDPQEALRPSRSPRKRPGETQSGVSGSGRILFESRLASIDEAMPAPKRARKSKMKRSLDIFSQDSEGESSNKSIHIYTDSKERVPDLDEDEDNPFITRKDEKTKRIGESGSPNRRKLRSETEAMARRARSDEGILYMFRGKPVFRPFDEETPLPRLRPRRLFQKELEEQDAEQQETEADESTEPSFEHQTPTTSQPSFGEEPVSPAPASSAPKRKVSSPFDSWKRTKPSSASTSGRPAKRRHITES